MTEIIIDDIEIEITKKNIKNIYLSVNPSNGEVRISAPRKMTEDAIRLFVVSKISWIEKQKEKFDNQEKIMEKEYITGESHYYFGESYLLNVIYQSSNKAKVEIRNKKYIDLYVKEGSSKEKREYIIKEWYRKELKSIIPSMIDKWEKIMNLKVKEWGVKQMKTRWGTCNPNAGRIWLNLELAKTPLHFLEYIIVHEMAHLIEKGHGDKFKAIMDKYYPNWRNVRKELKML
ncbi:SprT family zinc-dependent metalloprotease [Tissierella sp. MB52-C2]|uniref:M48 family metallopeptidase n=1 Tax=Tissierella sp. MB52-C2 TaxID=3070999 RepID=UPI00280A69E2|nr:SprT family zinc-dependent metalloprotease [Tissierella sp. MB52-C2]WMM25114.1 SprT family zinc-dependent metalloprotease [Tissierella sp. MB52-C2]